MVREWKVYFPRLVENVREQKWTFKTRKDSLVAVLYILFYIKCLEGCGGKVELLEDGAALEGSGTLQMCGSKRTLEPVRYLGRCSFSHATIVAMLWGQSAYMPWA